MRGKLICVLLALSVVACVSWNAVQIHNLRQRVESAESNERRLKERVKAFEDQISTVADQAAQELCQQHWSDFLARWRERWLELSEIVLADAQLIKQQLVADFEQIDRWKRNERRLPRHLKLRANVVSRAEFQYTALLLEELPKELVKLRKSTERRQGAPKQRNAKELTSISVSFDALAEKNVELTEEEKAIRVSLHSLVHSLVIYRYFAGIFQQVHPEVVRYRARLARGQQRKNR